MAYDQILNQIKNWRVSFVVEYIFLSLKIDFVIANIVDPDEMPHYAAFHLGLHCLPNSAPKESLV